MVALLLAAFLLGPAIALLLLTVILATVVDRYPQAKARIEKQRQDRYECTVCGAHSWMQLKQIQLPD